MSVLSMHLEQIAYCCDGIDSLPFPAPRIFTNALLSNHDITSLIRDTEPHERALFSVPAPAPQGSASTRASTPGGGAGDVPASSSRRQTVFNVSSGEVTTGAPSRGTIGGGGGSSSGAQHSTRRQTAVAAVLGGEMHEKLRPDRQQPGTGDVDVEVLLRGAEKLCGVYEVPGVRERIANLRTRHRNGKSTAVYYEARVAEQTEQLASMNKDWLGDDPGEEDEQEQGDDVWTEEDLRREEMEAREMEAKKKELQARLRAMNKDLGGLIR